MHLEGDAVGEDLGFRPSLRARNEEFRMGECVDKGNVAVFEVSARREAHQRSRSRATATITHLSATSTSFRSSAKSANL